MNKKTAIFSIFILMVVFLAFGIINVLMGRPSLLTSKLEGNNEPAKTTNMNNTKTNTEENKDYLKVKIKNEIKLGAKGDEVKKIQYFLKEKEYYKGNINGEYNAELTEAIKAFQGDNSLDKTGNLTTDVIEKITGDKMEMDYSKIAFTRDIYPNMTGLDVKKAQFILSKAGYYKGEITGTFDEETKKAVISFQRDKKITQTGNVGKLTQKALEEIKQ